MNSQDAVAKLDKDSKIRDKILNKNLWKVIIAITLPLATFGFFNFLYGFFDAILAAIIGNNEVTSVAIYSEIQLMINALGIGIASGTTVLVSRAYGAGDIDKARKYANTGFYLTLIANIVLVLVVILVGKNLLVLLNTPEDSINSGYGYYILLIMTSIFIAINNLYNALEKAKGNSKAVLKLNVIMLVTKILLSILFVVVLEKGIIWMGVASLISHIAMSIIAIFKITNKKFIFRITLGEIALKKEYLRPLIKVATPIFIGNFLFNFGKVIVNSILALYHPLAVGASSVVFKMGSGGLTFGNSFKESEPTIISQNLGKGQVDRAWKTFKISMIYTVIIGVIVVSYSLIFRYPILNLFINKDSTDEYINMILAVFYFEIFSKLTTAIVSTVTGMFQGFNYTKFEIMINLTRVFIIRIPMLLIFQNYTNLGFTGYGIILFTSNTASCIISLIAAYYFKKKRLHSSDLLENV